MTSPFVAQPLRDLDAALRAASRVAEQQRLPPPRLLRRGMNAIFIAGDVVLRVGHTTCDPAAALRLAELLAGHGIRVPRHRASFVDQVEHVSVVVQDVIEPSGEIDWEQIGRMIRTVHTIPVAAANAVIPVPRCTEFSHWSMRSLLRSVVDDQRIALDGDERRALERAVERLEHWPRAAAAASQVLCHGDVHPGNVIPTSNGPVVIDWDLLCVGPAAWDHAALLRWEERWGGEPHLYERFCAGYGSDLRDDALASTLADGRLLAATLMRLLAGATDEDARGEAHRRVRFWMGDGAAPTWQPA